MIKKILCLALVIFIIVGAVYSYNKVDFGQKTAMLFKVVFSGDEGMRGAPGGGPPQGGPPPAMGGPWQSPSRPGFRPNMAQGPGPGYGPPREMRGGQQPPSKKLISLQNIIPYAFILVFFVLITRFVELIIRKEFSSKFSDWIIFPMA
jgi:hypothetical protein